MNNNEFGLRLQEQRKGSKLSQGELAIKLDCSTSSISKYELGIRTPDILFLDKAADFFDVSVDYLLGRSRAKTNETDIKTICDYVGLSEKAIEKIRAISDETEHCIFNLLCEQNCINLLVNNLTLTVLSEYAILLTANVYKKSELLGKDTSEQEKQIKKIGDNTRHLEAKFYKIADSMHKSALKFFTKECNLTHEEMIELARFAEDIVNKEVNNISTDITSELLEMLFNNSDENHKGGENNG